MRRAFDDPSGRAVVTTGPSRLRGTPASVGLARGPVYLLEASPVKARATFTGDSEADRLREAIDRASNDLAQLQTTVTHADAAEILEFQRAMLADEALTEPAFQAVAEGVAADRAWHATMDEHIADYEAAGDEYFRARAADLRDMRDRVLRNLAGSIDAAVPAGAIVVASDLPPSRFLEIGWEGGGGIALFGGSANSHVATLARARGVPMIVQMTAASLAADDDVLLDAENGCLVTSPDSEALRVFGERQRAAVKVTLNDRAFLEAPAATATGQRVIVQLNVATRDDLNAVLPAHCDGIGLVRTELIAATYADLLDEERQYQAYREIVVWARGLPVTFRTIDAGGDKPIDGYTRTGEANPFLGVRGVRLALRHASVLQTQLRAFARTAVFGPVNVMVPMVTLPSELERVRQLLADALASLRDSGIACAQPRLGMMVEVPAAALTLDLFDADFFSIGSNDLIAYLTACGRDSDELTELADPLGPAVLRLLSLIVSAAQARNIGVSLCGDMASDERYLPALVRAGLRSISVAPAALARVKAALARIELQPQTGG